jgi:hypothetical protein
MTSSAIGKQTKEKRLVMKEFSTEITYDEENLLSMSKENLRVVLEKRANDTFISLLKFLDFPLMTSSAISLPLKSFLKLSLASLSASIKVSKCSINNFMALSLISNFASVKFLSYPYASHLGTGRRNISPSLCFKIKKATNGKFDFENITVLNKQ